MEPKDPAPAAASGALPKPAATDPGTVCTSWEKTRPFRGRVLTSCPLSTSPSDGLVGRTNSQRDRQRGGVVHGHYDSLGDRRLHAGRCNLDLIVSGLQVVCPV